MELLTPRGIAGVAIVRVVAGERAAVLGSLAPAPRGQAPSVRRARLCLDGAALDDVLVVDRGWADLELHLHGAPAVLDALHARFGLSVPSPASSADRLLQQALGEAQLELALEQRQYDFSACIAGLRGLSGVTREPAVAAALDRSRVALAMVTSHRVALVGRQNAGKSTLFNRLLARDRAVVGPTPGLTRDPVIETTVLAGFPYEFVDTAGEGPAATGLDRAAIERGRAQRVGAVAVLVVDGSSGPQQADHELLAASDLVIANKCDLPGPQWPAGWPCSARVSALTGATAALRGQFGELLRTHRGLPPAGRVGGFAALDAGQWAALAAVARVV
ncbi:MAG: GTPase [Planctomycetota bacterium]